MEFKEIKKNVWEGKEQGMKVPARLYVSDKLMSIVKKEGNEWNSLNQLRNVAKLPGILRYSLAMPDIHPGYGFPIGGVGAFDMKTGVIVMGGIGYDINCGVRTMKTPLTLKDIEGKKEKIATALFKGVPAGLGIKGDINLSLKEIDDLLENGAEFSLKKGYGLKKDLKYIESNGKISGALPKQVSQRAKQRQFKQLGTLGSGNHYLEVQVVDEIYDKKVAKAYGLFKDQILISFHCGSRALGHQIGMDWTLKLAEAVKKYNINIPDKELVCAPINSDEGKNYLGAVMAGINCAFANRQVIGHFIRKIISEETKIKGSDVEVLYEVAHNTAKIEQHTIDGKKQKVLVHRKGATRAFGPGEKELPSDYRSVGQPVLVGGTMGTYSYILHGTQKAMDESFGSACHGAGRILSRKQAVKKIKFDALRKSLISKGIVVKSHDKRGFSEEAPAAYKDINDVIKVMHDSGLAKKVVRVKPVIVVKG